MHNPLRSRFGSFVFVLILAATTSIFGTGCDSDSNGDEVSIIGTWQRNFAFGGGGFIDFHLTFAEDGTWGLGPAGQNQFLVGSYTLAGRRLTIQDAGCETPGDYDVRIVAERLVFDLVADDCFRNQIFTASWGAIEAP